MPINPSNILLSIMIISIPSRLSSLQNLMKKLEKQINDHNYDCVEIICLVDNKSKHIADKRNVVLECSSGKFVCCLDDDDDVSDDYIHSLVECIKNNQNIDLICFNQKCTLNGEEFNVSFNLNNEVQPVTRQEDGSLMNIVRPPFHICAWKSSLAKTQKFRQIYSDEGQSCEDYDWVVRLYPSIKQEYKIDKILHHYIFNSETTESVLKKDENL